MNIAVFHNVPPGGAKRVVLEELKYFQSRGFKVDLYSYKKGQDRFYNLDKYASASTYYNFELKKDAHGFGRLLKDLSYITNLKSISRIIAEDIDNKKYDILLVHPDMYTQAPYILGLAKTPKIYFCQELIRSSYEKLLDVNPNLPPQNYLYEKALRLMKKQIDRTNAQKADSILTASNFIKNKVKNAYKKDAQLAKLGVDSKVFRKSKTKDLTKITFVGDKEIISGYYFAKDIISSKVLKEKYELNVVNRKKGSLRLNDRQMAKILAESFLVLCTSFSEPFGLTAIESMACGTPVLAVNEGGYKESVVDGVTGYLLERKAKKFVDKIVFLSANMKLYEKMSIAGCRYIKSEWTWEKHGIILNKIIKNLIKEKKYSYE